MKETSQTLTLALKKKIIIKTIIKTFPVYFHLEWVDIKFLTMPHNY